MSPLEQGQSRAVSETSPRDGRNGPFLGTSSSLGERVRAARHELGLSQSQLAGADLTKGFISQIESGLVRPSVRSLQLIASRLAKPLDYFLGDEPLAARKRVTFHMLAAQAAAERRDWTLAKAEARAALALGPDPRERARALMFLARAELGLGEHELALEHVAEGLAAVSVDDDAALVAELLFDRGWAYFDLGQLVVSGEVFEAARAVVERHEVTDPRLRSRILVNLGTVYRRLNRTAKAVATYESALGVATRASELTLAARSHMGIAAALYDSGEYDAAINSYRRALELWERLADSDFELNALQSLAGVSFEQGDISGARDWAGRCLARAQETGDVRWAAVARVELARARLAEGHATEALALARSADAVLAAANDAQQHASAQRAIGAACDALGDFAASDEAYGNALALVTHIDHLATRSVIAAEYAQKLRTRGEIDRAFEMLELARGASARR